MNPSLLAMIAVVFGGAATALQAPTNAKMMTAVGSPVNAAFVSFAVGTAALGILAVILQTRPDMAASRALPWYAWVGGLYGAFFVAIAAYAAPRIGLASLITIGIAGQIVAAVWLDHIGALGLPREPINLGKVAGALLVVAGVVLVRRS